MAELVERTVDSLLSDSWLKEPVTALETVEAMDHMARIRAQALIGQMG
jgi:1-deoxy-D-xylulose-5-phosphate reductoisomerase